MSLFTVRYSEIGLKGNNRSFFESRLRDNLRRVFIDIFEAKVFKRRDHFLVEVPDEHAHDAIERLKHVPGVAYFAEIHRVSHDMQMVIDASLHLLRNTLTSFLSQGRQTVPFRVTVHRSDKQFLYDSLEIAKTISAAALPEFPLLKVNLSAPEVVLFIDWAPKVVDLYVEKVSGMGGLPVGSSGKVVALLSAGFDSPVASWRIMRRGAKAVFVHFHSYPVTSQESIEHVKALVQKLNRYQFESKLYLIPLIEYQKQVMLKAPAPLRVLLYRRMMLRLAHRVLYREHAKAFVTGESLAQVASQTLENLHVVDVLAERPILRPLIAMDKEEIIQQANFIDTAGLSAQPYEDCCSLYVPKSPALHASVEALEVAEVDLDVNAFVERLWSERKVVKIVSEILSKSLPMKKAVSRDGRID